MLENIDLTNVMSLDIETVPMVKNYSDLEEHWKKLWDIKSKQKYPNQTPEESWPMAGIFAEFGKIVCISVGTFVKWGKTYQIKVKSFNGQNETTILNDFIESINKHIKSPASTLAAHNGKEFDYPFIARRLVVNRIAIPFILDLSGKKPWEVNLIDTMDLWKFGDFKAYTSLNLIAACLNIPTPKDDIDGSQVYKVYYHENDLDRIKIYCQKDVVTLSRLILRLKGENDIPDEFVGYSN